MTIHPGARVRNSAAAPQSGRGRVGHAVPRPRAGLSEGFPRLACCQEEEREVTCSRSAAPGGRVRSSP